MFSIYDNINDGCMLLFFTYLFHVVLPQICHTQRHDYQYTWITVRCMSTTELLFILIWKGCSESISYFLNLQNLCQS